MWQTKLEVFFFISVTPTVSIEILTTHLEFLTTADLRRHLSYVRRFSYLRFQWPLAIYDTCYFRLSLVVVELVSVDFYRASA